MFHLIFFPINFFLISKVENMSEMFSDATNFNNGNQPLKFDTSNVTNMSGMFMNAENFNQPIEFNNTSKVKDMYKMFLGARNFKTY